MDDTQPWYLSRGIWGSLVAIAVSLIETLSNNHINILPEDQGQIVTLLLTLAGVISGGFALWGRIRATKQITLTKQ